MFSDIEERIVFEANYILENSSTIRKTAEKFGLSKSTVHKDLSQKLFYVNEALYLKVKKLLSYNLENRHLRGGIATKNKYMNLKKHFL